MKTTLTIRFASGREERFEMESLPGAEDNPEARLRKFIEAPSFALQIESEIVVIPTGQIEMMSLAIDGDQFQQRQLQGVRQARRLP